MILLNIKDKIWQMIGDTVVSSGETVDNVGEVDDSDYGH